MGDATGFVLAVVSLSSFYALLALGLGLIFGQLGVVNIAHGDFAMVGAYAMVVFAGVPFVLRLLLAVIVGLLLGLVTERLLLSKLYVRGFLATLLAMWGVGIILRQSVEAGYSSTPRSVQSPITQTITLLGATYPLYRLVAAAISFAIIIGLVAVVYKTSLGLRLRATIDNKEMAGLLGISTRTMITGTFMVGVMLAALAGAVQSPVLGVTPTIGISFLAPAFFAVLLGKPGSMNGPLLGAFVVAVLSTALRYFFSETVASLLFFLALIGLIAFKPQGINWRLPKWQRGTAMNI